MAIQNIKVSELNRLNVLTADDFFPVVDSGSMTTYRTDVNTINDWMAASGSCLSASYAPTIGSLFWGYTYAGSPHIYNLNVGNVGVKTLTPIADFDVNGLIHSTNLNVDSNIAATTISSSKSILTSRLYIPIYSSSNVWDGSPGDSSVISDSSIWFNSRYGYPDALSNDYARITFIDDSIAGDSGKLLILTGDNAPPTGNVPTNYTIVGPNIEELYKSEGGTLFGAVGSHRTGSILFVGADSGNTYARRVFADKFVAHDYNTSYEATYGTSSIAKTYTSTASVGFIGTASNAISASWAPVPAVSNYVKAFGSFFFDTTSSVASPHYLRNVMDAGSYNMKATSSYDSTYKSSSFFFNTPLSNNTYAVILTTDALVGTIDHGNPFKIIDKTVNSFTVKYQYSISGSSKTGTTVYSLTRLTQGSFIVTSTI